MRIFNRCFLAVQPSLSSGSSAVNDQAAITQAQVIGKILPHLKLSSGPPPGTLTVNSF
jgi:hypothetical protein